MFPLKIVTLMLAGLVTLLALRLVAAALNGAGVKVKAKQPESVKPVTRLAQDPRTGVYYPEE
ncbi:MAG: hypothetical protein ACREDX_04830 [Aestuariivirga sp.]